MQPGEELENLLQDLDDLVEDAKPVFGGGGRKQVDPEDIFAITDEIRDLFDREFTEARRVRKAEAEILAHAEQQADSIISDAQQQALILASDQEIVRLANQQAEEVRNQAQAYERDTRYNAEEYVESLLTRLEENLNSVVSSVSSCRATLTQQSSYDRAQGW